MRRVRVVFVCLAFATLVACQAPTRPVAPTPAQDDASHGERDATLSNPRRTKAPRAPRKPAPPALIAPTPPPDEVAAADLFRRLTTRLADPPCIEDRVVQRWERMYGRWATRLRSNLEAILPLLALVMDEIELHQLPGEFALIPIVESWYRPDAGSARSAYGMWQFTTPTARHHGLRIVPGFDERLAPQAATRAAMHYLASLHNRFGDWKLANMAFNAGEYRVQRVLAREGATPRVSAASHLPAGLSMTTYEHVAKIQALACLIAHPERFGLDLPDEGQVAALQTMALPADIASIEVAAARAGMTAAALRALNPAFAGGRIVAGAPRELLLPRRAAQRLQQAPANVAASAPDTSPPPAPSIDAPREYRVQRGDTLGAIAKRFGVRLRDLLAWNRLDVRALLHPGQRLRLEP